MLNSTRHPTGKRRQMNFQVKVMLSRTQNTKNTHRVRPKLMRVWTFLEKRNRYLGTLTLEKMPALPMREVMPWPVDSLK